MPQHATLLLQAGTPQRGHREHSPSLAMSPQASAPVVLPPEEPNLPKIRVIVRKRPLNRKVKLSALTAFLQCACARPERSVYLGSVIV